MGTTPATPTNRPNLIFFQNETQDFGFHVSHNIWDSKIRFFKISRRISSSLASGMNQTQAVAVVIISPALVGVICISGKQSGSCFSECCFKIGDTLKNTMFLILRRFGVWNNPVISARMNS
jgi:hypothetical protein